MLVRLETDGGFAFVPGRNRPITVDSNDLGPVDAAKLAHLVEIANFFALPVKVGRFPPDAADVKRYTVTVEDGTRRHAVSFVDPVTDMRLAALRDFVRATAG